MSVPEGLVLQLFENLLLPFSSCRLLQRSTCSGHLIPCRCSIFGSDLPYFTPGLLITSKRDFVLM